ncbi:hypothetical protein QT381_06415 [Galbitalea sp. SE-J8]|uniref:hypothetical protein n=1 Tax=Galbitalea sp. SE-J8 TaxID=3054952 RepID=UPI00259C9A10|nr:hypothetical protein [Galbitalea sp. SE-J8]MDM4762636.1 hypothetical protein [Galbitalea sp. SE-J8]
MARWAPQKQDVLDALATEITTVYPDRAIIAILADDPAESAAFGRDLADAIDAAGRAATVASTFDGASADAVTIVTGPVARDETNLTRSHVQVWLDHGRDEDRALRRSIGIVLDVSDPEHPRRRFADSC